VFGHPAPTAAVVFLKNADVRKTKTLWENGVRGTAVDINCNDIINSYDSFLKRDRQTTFNAYAKKKGHN